MMTVRDAVYEWVSRTSGYPQGMIEILMEAEPEKWCEVTIPTVHDRICVYDGAEGEIKAVKEDVDGLRVYTIETDNGDTIFLTDDDFEVCYDSTLPMWGTLWAFDEYADKLWMENEDGVRVMSDCGFRVYEHDDWGYFLGVDGCGYDFYSEHWIPAYRARGLQWHDKEDEEIYGWTD